MPLPLIPIAGAMFASFSLTAIRYLLPFIVISLIKFLGVSLITYAAVSVTTDAISGHIISNFNNIGGNVLAILKIAGFLDAINVLLAGWAAQVQLRQILGSFSKLKFTPPSSS
jgi:cell division protein FtsX